jgi:hypothetical protein
MLGGLAPHASRGMHGAVASAGGDGATVPELGGALSSR